MKTQFLCFILLAATGLAAEPPNAVVIESGFINEHAPYPQCHASTIAEVGPGKLVAAWFGGTRERAPDVGIWLARQENGRWLDAVEVANGVQPDGTRQPTWNPVLFQPKDGPLVLFYKVGPSPSQWWGMMMKSADGGKSWSVPVRLPDGVLGPIKDKPVLLADGAWLCPSSTEGSNAGWRVHFELTRDAGQTWEIIGPVDRGNNLDAIQPTVLFHSDGRFQALCRTRNGVIATTWSSDGGRIWSPLAATSLPNPNSGIDAVTLSDGRQLLVYNHSVPPPDRPTKGVRYPLDVAISSDGITWQHVLTVEDRPCESGYAYPAVIQTADGLVHITYTWNRQHIKYVVLDPKQLVPTDARASSDTSLRVTDLRCEFGANPLGIDVAQPRLFWRVASDERGQRQTAYQILAASSAEILAKDRGDLWDSGRVASDETTFVRYAGAPLASSQPVFWKVRAWGRDGHATRWSPTATWTMGLLDESDWHALWIGGGNTNSATILLRREFGVKPHLLRAVAHVCGLGEYEMSVNGHKVGDDLLTPGWTNYRKVCLYDTRDITAYVRRGRNVVDLLLGNGMYNVTGGRFAKFKGSFGPLQAIAQLRLEYADGTVEVIGTDEHWRTAGGPITFSCIYGGEDYDARRKPVWGPAKLMSGPGGELEGFSHTAPAIQEFDILKPVKVAEIRPGVKVYDLGQNAAQMVRVKARGKAGSVVKITPSELLNEDGTVYSAWIKRGASYWQYTLAGRGSETYFPRFFYYGCRYLQVETTGANVESIEGVVVHSSSPPVGKFSCSNELFNRIHTLVRWAQRSNMMSVLTDCPHREKLGWLEQYHLNGPSLRYEFDLARLYTKGINDMADAQHDDGLVPDIAPEYTKFKDGFLDSPEWGSAFILAAWQQYEFTGDLGLFRRHFDAMKRYAIYLGRTATNNIVSHGLGDWYDIGPKRPGMSQLTPIALTATAHYQADVVVLAKAAKLLGRADAGELETQAGEIRAAFVATWPIPTNSQCAAAIALTMGLVEETNRTAVVGALVHDVGEKGLTAGDVGYRYLLRALAENGRSDTIFEMNNQSDRPGYGYQLKMGATSLTEAWTADRHSSQNHFMLGQINEWFYHDLAGIGCDPDGPGFKKIILRPQPVGDLTWVEASYESIHGPISVRWEHNGERFVLKATIPANTTATVFLPAREGAEVREGGATAERSGVKFLRREGDRAVFAIESGSYIFESQFGHS